MFVYSPLEIFQRHFFFRSIVFFENGVFLHYVSHSGRNVRLVSGRAHIWPQDLQFPRPPTSRFPVRQFVFCWTALSLLLFIAIWTLLLFKWPHLGNFQFHDNGIIYSRAEQPAPYSLVTYLLQRWTFESFDMRRLMCVTVAGDIGFILHFNHYLPEYTTSYR